MQRWALDDDIIALRHQVTSKRNEPSTKLTVYFLPLKCNPEGVYIIYLSMNVQWDIFTKDPPGHLLFL